MTRIAVIADIHGNVAALEAVLADIAARKADQVINLGDVVSGPLWPRETLALLDQHPMLTVRGNHDRWVFGPDPSRMGASERYAHGQLDAVRRHWLGGFPAVAEAGHGILAFHTSPGDDNRYLLEEVHERRLVRAGTETIRERLGYVSARIVLCGHSHLPHVVQLPDGPLLVNPGSVGCPAYDDFGAAEPVSESGSPHARYAVLTIGGAGIDVEMIALTYPREAAAKRAEQNGRAEWAHGLRCGFMPVELREAERTCVASS